MQVSYKNNRQQPVFLLVVSTDLPQQSVQTKGYTFSSPYALQLVLLEKERARISLYIC